MYSVIDEVNEVLPQVIRMRHDLHQNPELTWKEINTSAYVAERLAKIPGIEVQTGVGKLGVVGLLHGDQPGPTVGLRADLDALPIQEISDLPYRSCNDGIMHACGHDGHTANLLGVAMILSRCRHLLRGTVKLIFQPAEEGGAGADVMCKHGVLENPKVDVIFGMHGWPEAPCGEIWVRPGPMMAANCEFSVKIRGAGCHAAMPHLGDDTLLAACRMVNCLQSVVSRKVPPTQPAVLSVSQIQGGTATNIIPSTVEFSGTLRTMSSAIEKTCLQEAERICQGIGTAHSVEVLFKSQSNYPVTINHEKSTDYVIATARKFLGDTQVHYLETPTMGSEDFSFFLQKVPGCYFFVGLNDRGNKGYPALHHPEFDFNDHAFSASLALMSHLALQYGSR